MVLRNLTNSKAVLLEMNIENDKCVFPSTISDALIGANDERLKLEKQLNETLDTIKALTPECDKYDYILAAGSGALCGLIDIFLVGKPGESPLGEITDKWFADRTVDFAKYCGFSGDDNSLSSAIGYLEKKFKIPYDQSVGGGVFRELINLTPSNHHFKSLGHNPTLLGLFFSILNQFNNTSDFVSDGRHISLNNSDSHFELRGHNVPSKIFCGIANWIGHLISDVFGSSSSKGRGMGIPSPILAWSNDIIVIEQKLNIPVSEFDKSIGELALKMFEKGYDVRFQTAQAIPVFINEMVVRLLYSIRRLIKYFITIPKEERSLSRLWKSCEPFSNATVKRMLTVAHGTFCLIDIGDASIRAMTAGVGTFNITEFLLRFNVIGIGRFTISLYGEVKRGVQLKESNAEAVFIKREIFIVDDYIEGLKELSKAYNDKDLLPFVVDFQKCNLYKDAFAKSVQLAKLRNVPDEKSVKSKAEIDNYFRGGSVCTTERSQN